MTANKHHSQAVILDFLSERRRPVGGGIVLFQQTDHFGFLVANNLLPSNVVNREILRDLHDPGSRILRNSVVRPSLERPGKRFLDQILRQVETINPKNARQPGNQLSPFMPEKMFHYLW